MSSAKAFQSCIVAGAAPEDRETILMLEAQSLRSQHATIDGIARGTIDAADATRSKGARRCERGGARVP